MKSQDRHIDRVPNKGDCGFDCADIFLKQLHPEWQGFNMRKTLSALISTNSATLVNMISQHHVFAESLLDWILGLQVRSITKESHDTIKIGDLQNQDRKSLDYWLKKYELSLSNTIDLLVEMTYFCASDFCERIVTDDHASVNEAVRNLYLTNVHWFLMVAFNLCNSVVVFSGTCIVAVLIHFSCVR